MSSETIENLSIVKELPQDVINGSTFSISQANPNTYTHIFFKYPCKFIPEIPRWAIKKYLKNSSQVVFDPFVGSGTTLLEANILGFNSYGTEIDSIAKLVTRVKTTPMSKKKINNIKKLYLELLEGICADTTRVYYPEINNLRHWFNEENLTHLGKLKTLIEGISDKNIREFFLLCFVSIIKRVSNADDISPKPYVSTRIEKIPPTVLDEFKKKYCRYLQALIDYSELNVNQTASIVEGDALNIELKHNVDLAITSPPYINAFDYARTLRLENLWIGAITEDQLRKSKKKYVGTENFSIRKEEENLKILEENVLLMSYYKSIYSEDPKRALIVKKFFEDMKRNLEEVYKVLNFDGHYIIVIGNSRIRGNIIESWKVIEQLSENVGFSPELNFSYVIQNPYIRIPRKNRGGKINQDYVLVLRKRR